MNREGFDEFDNPRGKSFDLGGVEDERLHGEKILLYVAYHATYEKYEWHHASVAVAERNIQMDILEPTSSQCTLTETQLGGYSQLWYVSDQKQKLSQKQITMIAEFVKAGNGLLIWADNKPFYADANLLARALIGTEFSGNRLGDKIMLPGERLSRGHFIEHPLTSGVNQLYEGITICTIKPTPKVTILAQSHDGQNCMACFEEGKQRIVLDTGFTKLLAGAFHKTAGTARYFRNIAFWLSRGARDFQYTPFTPGLGKTPTINQNEESPRYQYQLKQPAPIKLLVQWERKAALELVVQNTSGSILFQATSDISPIRFESPLFGGTLVFWVRGADIPYSDFPYSLTLVESAKPTSSNIIPVSTHSIQLKEQPDPLSHGQATRDFISSGAQDHSSATTTRVNPGVSSSNKAKCLIFLLDQSVSTSQYVAGSRPNSDRRLSDVLATILNSFLNTLVDKSNQQGATFSAVDIAVTGYGGGVRSLIGDPGARPQFLALRELLTKRVRTETHIVKQTNSTGAKSDTPIDLPVWIKPLASGERTFLAALQSSSELAAEWAEKHLDDFPPILVNITTGASADGNPTAMRAALASVKTHEGSMLIFNCHINPLSTTTILFPQVLTQLPDDPSGTARQLFELSSEFPKVLLKSAVEVLGVAVSPSARTMIFNADLLTLRQVLLLATRELTQSRNLIT